MYLGPSLPPYVWNEHLHTVNLLLDRMGMPKVDANNYNNHHVSLSTLLIQEANVYVLGDAYRNRDTEEQYAQYQPLFLNSPGMLKEEDIVFCFNGTDSFIIHTDQVIFEHQHLFDDLPTGQIVPFTKVKN